MWGDTCLAPGGRAFINVPLVVAGRTIGVLHLDAWQPGVFTADHARIATAVGEHVALAVQQKQLLEQSGAFTGGSSSGGSGGGGSLFGSLASLFGGSGAMMSNNRATKYAFSNTLGVTENNDVLTSYILAPTSATAIATVATIATIDGTSGTDNLFAATGMPSWRSAFASGGLVP